MGALGARPRAGIGACSERKPAASREIDRLDRTPRGSHRRRAREQLLERRELGRASSTRATAASRSKRSPARRRHPAGDLRPLPEPRPAAVCARRAEERHRRAAARARGSRRSRRARAAGRRSLAGVRRFLDAVASRPRTWRVILLAPAGTPPIVRQHIETNRAQTLRRIERLVRWALERPELPDTLDVELTARAIRDLGEEAGRMVLTDPERYPPERYERFVGAVMIARLAARWRRSLSARRSPSRASIRRGELSAREVVDAHIERHRAVGSPDQRDRRRAFRPGPREADAADARVASTSSRSRGERLPPLLGVPFTVKESIALDGMPQLGRAAGSSRSARRSRAPRSCSA